MILVIHIAIALTGMLLTGLAYLKPSKTKLYASSSFLAGTLLSGTYLVVSTNGHLMRACITGLVYTAIVAFGIYAANKKLATQTS